MRLKFEVHQMLESQYPDQLPRFVLLLRVCNNQNDKSGGKDVLKKKIDLRACYTIQW